VPSAEADSEEKKGLEAGLKASSTRSFTAIEFFSKLRLGLSSQQQHGSVDRNSWLAAAVLWNSLGDERGHGGKQAPVSIFGREPNTLEQHIAL
jgi:hypothetical protein